MKTIIYSLLSLLCVLLISCGTETTPIYTLTTSVNGEGTISPSSGEFEEGETVTLTSTPSEHWIFDSWSGDGSGTSNTLTITMNSDKSVIALFERKNYPLSITVEGEGNIQERIVSQPKTTDYPFETVVELTAVPEDGWKFLEWSGDLNGNENPKEITITNEKTVTAEFIKIAYLAENGITIMCPNGSVGELGVVDGLEYEVVDRNLLIQRRDEGEDLTKVCTSLVTDTTQMFSYALQFNQPIGNWDVSNVTNMSGMFLESTFNQPIGDWDVSNVTNMVEMFRKATQFDQPIGNWNVSNVTDMSGMFRAAYEFNQPIGNWDVSNVTDMAEMFVQALSYNQPIGDWDVSSVTNMRLMFQSTPFNQPIGNWNVSNVTDMAQMFFLNSQFNQPIGNWNVSNVTDMSAMFGDSPFNQPIGNWNVSNVTDMRWMFRFSTFNQPIGEWDVNNVNNMDRMFYRATNFNQNLSKWCVSQIPTVPEEFSTHSPLIEANKPVWGTCPD